MRLIEILQNSSCDQCNKQFKDIMNILFHSIIKTHPLIPILGAILIRDYKSGRTQITVRPMQIYSPVLLKTSEIILLTPAHDHFSNFKLKLNCCSTISFFPLPANLYCPPGKGKVGRSKVDWRSIRDKSKYISVLTWQLLLLLKYSVHYIITEPL